MTEPADDWITVPEAARLLGVATHTAYDLIDRGHLAAEITMPPGPRRRRRVRLLRSAVDDLWDPAAPAPGHAQ